MAGPGGLGCHCYFRASRVFEMKGKKTASGMLWQWFWCFFPFFFCEVFIPTKSHNLRRNVRVSKGNAVLLTLGFWWAVVTWRSTTGGRWVRWQAFFCHDQQFLKNLRRSWFGSLTGTFFILTYSFHRKIIRGFSILNQISIFGTRIRSNQCNPLWRGVSYCKHGNFLRFLGLGNVESFLWFLR